MSNNVRPVEQGEDVARKIAQEVGHRIGPGLAELGLAEDVQRSVRALVASALVDALPRASVLVSVSPEDGARLGHDMWSWADRLHTAMVGAAAMRAGRIQRKTATDTIYALDRKLLPVLEGVRDAAIRAHRACGGTVDELTVALDTDSRSTAQYHRKRLADSLPSLWETVAWRGGPDRLDDGNATRERLDRIFSWETRLAVVHHLDGDETVTTVGELMIVGDCNEHAAHECVARIHLRRADRSGVDVHVHPTDLLVLVDPPTPAEVAYLDARDAQLRATRAAAAAQD